MLWLYNTATSLSAPFLRYWLKRRMRKGREDPERLDERMGHPSATRPDAKLIWIHAASVGEAQSMLVLIDYLHERDEQLHFLVTTGTRTSAEIMTQRLPQTARHQFVPLDHPNWVRRFLDHWRPDLGLWTESELWPNMLRAVDERDIPAALLNARLSPRSYKRWQRLGKTAQRLLNVFDLILAQDEEQADYFRKLGARHVEISESLKYAAAPLPVADDAYKPIAERIGARPCWLFASTHDGEEDLAARVHAELADKYPDLLTMIVPRHPERRDDIAAILASHGLNYRMRGAAHQLPRDETQIYVADTLGELGLFYKLAPIAVIGRSFSRDGGGGHNPVEAAHFDCAIVHGADVQNLQQLYDAMDKAGATLPVDAPDNLAKTIDKLLSDEDGRAAIQNRAHDFAAARRKALPRVLDKLKPVFERAGIAPPRHTNRADMED